MEATLTDLPLFPLRTVLFPGGWLPLQIFEVRYLDMVQRRHAQGLPFGVVCLTKGDEAQQRADGAADDGTYLREDFHTIGTLAHIRQLTRPQPGLLMIRCEGSQRFLLNQHDKLAHGLWVGQAQLLPEDAAIPVPPDLAKLGERLRALAPRIAAELPGTFPYAMDDPGWHDAGWLANRWCELLPIAPEARQNLMALDSPLLRLELASDWLDKLPTI